MWTAANATVPSREICRAAAPRAKGLSTRSTWRTLALCPSVRWIRAFVAGSFTSPAAKTTWFVSVDAVLKLSVRRFRAVVDSVPGKENESVWPERALALRPPRTTSATIQTARTTNLWVKHQRARALIGAGGYAVLRGAHPHLERAAERDVRVEAQWRLLRDG